MRAILSTGPCPLSWVIITVVSFLFVHTFLHWHPITINYYFMGTPNLTLHLHNSTWGSDNLAESPSISSVDNQTDVVSQDESPETMGREDAKSGSDVSMVPASAPASYSEELTVPENNNIEKIDDSSEIVSVENGSLSSLNFIVPVAPLVSPPTNNFEKPTWKSCDLYRGKWIHDPAGPLYKSSMCPSLSRAQNCQANGRPDNDYENWRWKPHECELPRFDARKFLELMRGKTLAFVGDSLTRNQMESMMCILWQVEAPTKHGSRVMHRWYFASTSTTIIRIWSAWLVHSIPPPAPFGPRKGAKVHLDIPDETFMELLPDYDVLVLSSGHWFTPEVIYFVNGTSLSEPLQRPKRSRRKKAKPADTIRPYGISLHTVLNAIVNLRNYTGLTILRTHSPDHYEGGRWNTGGSCAGFVRPADKSVVRNGYGSALLKMQVTEFGRMVKRVRNGSKLRLMDITELSGYRHDGHAGPYRPGAKVVGNKGRNGPEDCVHWCMPGAVDTWNEVLFEIIRREFCTGPDDCY